MQIGLFPMDSMISVFTIGHFNTTRKAPYYACANKCKPRSDPSLRNGLINVFIICSKMMSCEKDSLYMANSVINGQNALDGMVGSKLALYAQENCHLLHSLSNTEFKGSDDMAKR